MEGEGVWGVAAYEMQVESRWADDSLLLLRLLGGAERDAISVLGGRNRVQERGGRLLHVK